MPRHQNLHVDPEQLDLLDEVVCIAFSQLVRQRARAFLLVYECYSTRWVVEELRGVST